MSQARTIWFTGLSGAGKTTLANTVAHRLKEDNRPVFVLDGDVVRTGLCSDLGFSLADRSENIRRVAEVARLFNLAGAIVIAALISPLREDRARAQSIVGPDRFLEIWLSTPLDTCEQRDVKGLYAKARQGLIHGFTGISSPYEAPEAADLVLDTSWKSPDDCAAMILELINPV